MTQPMSIWNGNVKCKYDVGIGMSEERRSSSKKEEERSRASY